MNEAKEYLTTGRLGAYYPEKATIKKSEDGTARAVYQDSDYTVDDVNYTRERSSRSFRCLYSLSCNGSLWGGSSPVTGVSRCGVSWQDLC